LTKKPPRVCTEVLDCPIWLERVILQLMEKDPASRPRDALAVAQALKEVADKVAKHVSVAQHTVTGEPTSIVASSYDADVAKNLLKKKKKKKKDNSPIWEQTWFLASGLSLLVALVVFMMWPKSEGRLYALAQPMMKSDDLEIREEAKKEYLDELIRRFPNGPHTAEAREFVENVEADRYEKMLMIRIEKGREKGELESHFKKAFEFEKFGDRVSAMEMYASLNTVYASDPEAAPIRNLARRRVAELEKTGSKSAEDRLKFIAQRLEEADRLDYEGKALAAKNIWNGLISLYGSNQELKRQVSYAQARKDGKSRLEVQAILGGETPQQTAVDPNGGAAPNQQAPPEGQQ
jgi:hypothetical protein